MKNLSVNQDWVLCFHRFIFKAPSQNYLYFFKNILPIILLLNLHYLTPSPWLPPHFFPSRQYFYEIFVKQDLSLSFLELNYRILSERTVLMWHSLWSNNGIIDTKLNIAFTQMILFDPIDVFTPDQQCDLKQITSFLKASFPLLSNGRNIYLKYFNSLMR